MSAPFFTIESDTMGKLRLSGAISFANAARALEQVPLPLPSKSGGGALELDLSALQNPDSATLAVLIAWASHASQRGASLRYSNAPQGLRNLARLCAVDTLLGLN